MPGVALAELQLERLALSEAEVELMLRICRRHRSAIPIYLHAVREELCLIDEVIRKLSETMP